MRIFAHLVVGPGEAGRYLPSVLDRTARWVDEIFVALDPTAGEQEFDVAREFTNHTAWMPEPWVDHEGRFRQNAWDAMSVTLQPTHQDMILLLDADELVVDPEPLRDVVRHNAGSRIGFTFHEMWSLTHYRTDGFWKPYPAWIMIPWKPDGQIRDRALACGREPTYAVNVPKVGLPISSILHYGYALKEDRESKYERYMSLDGGQYHNLNHIQSIIATPQLAEWRKGGLL